jgi:hypothetical protein
VRVEDVDAHYAAAWQAGAGIVRAPETFDYEERQYVALDRRPCLDLHPSVGDAGPRRLGATDVHT